MELSRNMIDQVIFKLFDGTAKYKRSFNYDELVENWEDSRPVPEKTIIVDTWNEIVAEKELKHPEFYKWQNSEWVLNTSKKQELRTAIDTSYDAEADTDFGKEFFGNCKKIAQDSKTQDEYQLSLYNNLKAKSESNENRKNILASKTMQELMDIYNSIT